MSEHQLTRSAFRGVAWTVAKTLGSRGMSTVVFVVLARLLDPSAFGLVALASVFVALMQVFVDQGFSQSLVQRDELEDEHIDSAFWASLAIGATLTGLGLATAGPVADLLGQPHLAPVLRALSLSLLITSLSSTPEGLLSRKLLFRSLALRQLLATAIGGGAAIAAAVAGFGVWSLVTQILVQAGVGALVLWIAVPWRPHLRFSRRHFMEVASFGGNVVVVSLLNFLNRRADDFLIGAVLGPRALGVYSIAYRLLLLLTDVMTRAIDVVAFPLFSRVQKEPARMRRGYLQATRVSTTIAVPVFLAMAALAPELIPLVFGEHWHAAVPVMQILSFIGVLHASLFFNSTVLLASGNPRRVVALASLNAVTNVAAFAVAVHWGVAAVAAAYVIRGYVVSPLPVLMVRRVIHFRWSEYLPTVGIPFVAGAVMVLLMEVTRSALPSDVGRALTICAVGLVGAVDYLLVLRVLWPDFAREMWSNVEAAFPVLRRGEGRAHARAMADA